MPYRGVMVEVVVLSAAFGVMGVVVVVVVTVMGVPQ